MNLFAPVVAAICLCPASTVDPLTYLHGCLSAAGDLNGDGVPDLWVAGRPDDEAWRSRLHDGVDLTGHTAGVNLTGHVWALSGIDGAVLLHIESDRAADVLGRSMASAGDVDHDGIPDLVVGGGGRMRGTGYVDVRSGLSGALLYQIESAVEDELFGFDVAGGRDLNGDGTPDLVVAARSRARVYSGADGSPLFLLRECDVTRPSNVEVPCAGVALLPDLNGDGRPEVADGGHVYSGANGEPLLQLTPGEWVVGALGDVDADGTSDVFLSDVNQRVTLHSGADGELIHEWDYTGGYLYSEGMTVDAIGDVDGDGVSDLAIGASEAPVLDDPPDGGFAQVVSGKTGETIHIEYAPPNDGYDVSAIGDIDGDGRPDLAIARRATQEVVLLSSKDWKPIWKQPIAELLDPDPDRPR